MYTVYVLYSISHNKIYVGYTSNLLSRYHSHNSHSKKGYTLRYRPWIVAYTEIYTNKSESMKRERQLKSAKGRKYIWEEIIPNYK